MLKHGHTTHTSQSKTYHAWLDMRRRCSNPNTKNYNIYGGRGIKVCDRWNSFVNFLEDMGVCPGSMTLDRRNNNESYSPDNCRWITKKENCQNTSVSKRWFIEGVEYKSKSEASEALGVSRVTIRMWCIGRFRNGRMRLPRKNCNARKVYLDNEAAAEQAINQLVSMG